MTGGLLRKLRGRSLRELSFRAAQWAAVLGERTGIAADVRQAPSTSSNSALRAALPAWSSPRHTAALAWQIDPAGAAALIARARRIAAGQLDLLGYHSLDFGRPTQWHLDPVHDRRAPMGHWSTVPFLDATRVGDHKVIWELNRHQHFVTLAQAALLTGDAFFVRTVERELASWLDANPPKQGINWASSLEAAFRAISWCWTLSLLRDEGLDPALVSRAVRMLRLHGRHIARNLSTYFSPNTHLTGEALGLLYLGCTLPDLSESPQWRAQGWSILREELFRQTYDDGVYYEHSLHYQRYVADFYLHALLLQRGSGAPFDDVALARVQDGLDVLQYAMRGDGTLPLIGDDDGGRLLPLDSHGVADVRPTLALGASLANWTPSVPGLDAPELTPVWVLGATAPVAAPGARSRSRLFRTGGFAMLRTGWQGDADGILLRTGPHTHPRIGGAHAHADQLSVDVSFHGRALISDSGTCSYVADAEARRAFRSAFAHNALTLSGSNGTEPLGPFGWHTTRDAWTEAWVESSVAGLVSARLLGSGQPMQHTRTVLQFEGMGFVIHDQIEVAQPGDIVASYQLAPGVTCELHGTIALLRQPGEGLVVLQISGAVAVSEEPGWVAPVYGQRLPATRIVCRLAAPGGQGSLFTTLSRAEARVTARPVEGGLELTGAYLRMILRAGNPGDAALDEGRSDAPMAWVARDSAGALVHAGRIGGTVLRHPGMPVLAAERADTWQIARRTSEGWLLLGDALLAGSA